MRVFVTGAASPLGRAVVSALAKGDHRVVGLVRRLSGVAQMRNLGAEPVMGDVRRSEELVKAMAGVDTVYHLASFFDFWTRHPGAFDAVNVGGTKNIIAAAIVAKARRVVVCSSALTIGAPSGEVGDEFSRHRGFTESDFERSKLAAERLALRLRGKGIEIVVVNPSLVIAPVDPGWTGRMIARRVAGKRQFAGRAPLGWIYVDDAAKGIVRAGELGTDGDRYVLNGETLSSATFLRRVASAARSDPPTVLPRTALLGIGAAASGLARASGHRPILALPEARFLGRGFQVDGRHGAERLGLAYTPMTGYLQHVVDSYRQALTRFTRPR